MKTTIVEADTAPVAVGGYAQAMLVEQAERILYISGQVPETMQGKVPADFDSQCYEVWANLRAQLKAAGMSINNIVKVTVFLSSREYAEANGAIRREVMGGHCPALTVIISEIFDERWLLEIEAIAAD